MKGKIIGVEDCIKLEGYPPFHSMPLTFSIGSYPNKFQKSVNFDKQELLKVSYEIPVQEIISGLLNEVNLLRERVDSLEKSRNGNFVLVQDTLKEIWDNKKDDVWNDF